MDGEKQKNDELYPVKPEKSDPKPSNINVERLMDSFDKAIEEGLPQLTEYQATEKRKDRDLEDKKNKRVFGVSLLILVMFFAMWFTTMFMGKFEMATTILQIILAIGAGAGIVSALK